MIPEFLKNSGPGKWMGDQLGGLKEKVDKYPIVTGLALVVLGALIPVILHYSGVSADPSSMGGMMMTLVPGAMTGMGLYALYYGLDKKFSKSKVFQVIKKIVAVIAPLLMVAGIAGTVGWMMFHSNLHNSDWFLQAAQGSAFFIALPLTGLILLGIAKAMGSRNRMRRIGQTHAESRKPVTQNTQTDWRKKGGQVF